MTESSAPAAFREGPWGYHFAVNAVCSKEKVADPEVIKAFSKDLVDAIDMKAFGDPIVVHFATHDPVKAGYSLVQLIETSNICGHFVDATGEAYIDVFSCKEFDPNVVLQKVHEYFEASLGNFEYFERDAKVSKE